MLDMTERNHVERQWEPPAEELDESLWPPNFYNDKFYLEIPEKYRVDDLPIELEDERARHEEIAFKKAEQAQKQYWLDNPDLKRKIEELERKAEARQKAWYPTTMEGRFELAADEWLNKRVKEIHAKKGDKETDKDQGVLDVKDLRKQFQEPGSIKADEQEAALRKKRMNFTRMVQTGATFFNREEGDRLILETTEVFKDPTSSAEDVEAVIKENIDGAESFDPDRVWRVIRIATPKTRSEWQTAAMMYDMAVAQSLGDLTNDGINGVFDEEKAAKRAAKNKYAEPLLKQEALALADQARAGEFGADAAKRADGLTQALQSRGAVEQRAVRPRRGKAAFAPVPSGGLYMEVPEEPATDERLFLSRPLGQ